MLAYQSLRLLHPTFVNNGFETLFSDFNFVIQLILIYSVILTYNKNGAKYIPLIQLTEIEQ